MVRDETRLNEARINTKIKIFIQDARDYHALSKLLDTIKPNIIIHLAAQAGVRYSIGNPDAYLSSNIIGTFNVIKIANKIKVKHLIIGLFAVLILLVWLLIDQNRRCVYASEEVPLVLELNKSSGCNLERDNRYLL